MTALALSPASEQASKKSFREVWLISIGHSLTHWYPATFYLLLPLIGQELGLSYLEIGSVFTVQASAGALSNIPGGLIVDSVPRKGLLMAIALFWVGAPYLLMGFTHQYWTLLTCAALVGIGNNIWHPTAIPLLAQNFPERRGLAVSIHGMGGNMGDAIAPFVAGMLLTYMNWRTVVMVNLLPGVVMACIILASLGRLQAKPRSTNAEGTSGIGQKVGRKLKDFARLLRNRTLIFLCASSIFRSMTQGALMTFLPLFLARQMGYSPRWVGAVMAGLQLAGFAAAPIAGHLSDTMGRRQIIVSSMTTSFVVLLFMAIAGNSPYFVMFVAVLGFFLFAVRAVLQAWLLDATPPDMGGSSIGLLFAIQALGAASGPFIGGLIADRWGIMTVFYFLAATIVVANMFIFVTPVPSARFAPSTDSEVQ
ncbi:MAG TPA: MFS transporter [Xanthobacteraceae bacterium]|jgi:MFS family permease